MGCVSEIIEALEFELAVRFRSHRALRVEFGANPAMELSYPELGSLLCGGFFGESNQFRSDLVVFDDGWIFRISPQRNKDGAFDLEFHDGSVVSTAKLWPGPSLDKHARGLSGEEWAEVVDLIDRIKARRRPSGDEEGNGTSDPGSPGTP